MEKFSRYTDNKQRLFVIIERWSKAEVESGEIKFTPTTVTLLNVHAETAQTLPFAEVEKFIKEGKLIKIEKKV